MSPVFVLCTDVPARVWFSHNVSKLVQEWITQRWQR